MFLLVQALVLTVVTSGLLGLAAWRRAHLRRLEGVLALRELWGEPLHDGGWTCRVTGRVSGRPVVVRGSSGLLGGCDVSVEVRTGGPPQGVGVRASAEAESLGAHLDHGRWSWSASRPVPVDELQAVVAVLVEAALASGESVAPPPPPEPARPAVGDRLRALHRSALLAAKPGASSLPVTELRAFLQDQDPAVVVAAARRLGAAEGGPRLLALAETEERATREAALVALAELGVAPERVELGLLTLLDPPTVPVLEALGRVGGRASAPALRELQTLGLTAVGRAASAALARVLERDGPGAGRVGVVGSRGGELTEPRQDEGGELSLPEERR